MDGGLNANSGVIAVEEVDWIQIGKDLAERGWNATRVANTLNLPRGTVRWWFEGYGEPKYTNGQAIMRLYVRVVAAKPVRAAWAVNRHA